MTAEAQLARHEQIFAERAQMVWGKFAEHSIDLSCATIAPVAGLASIALCYGGFTLGRFSPKIMSQMLGQLPPDAKGLM